MLKLLLGTDLTAKRLFVDETVMRELDAGKKVRLVVPEQENFNRDRRLMEVYGEKKANLCRTTSFTHFTGEFLEEKGIPVRPKTDRAGQALFMSLALSACKDDLRYFARYDRRPASLELLTAFYREMKYAGLGPDALQKTGEVLSGSLQAKTRELYTVFSAYEGLVTARFSDENDDLMTAADLLLSSDDLRETTFYFDDFRGFTAPQMAFLSALMRVSAGVVVSLPTGAASDPTATHFAHALKNRAELVDAARAAGIPVFEETVPVRAGGGLAVLRRDLFNEAAPGEEPTPADITILKTADRYEECDLIAAACNELLTSNACRARDVAVLYRDESLTPVLLSAMKKYGVPAYADRRRAMITYPLVRMLLSAVTLAADGFDTETLFSYLKTDVAGVTMEETAALENYVYRWQITGKGWETPFTASPSGFGAALSDEDEAVLSELNAIRERVVAPLKKLRRRLHAGTGKTDAEAVFLFLKETKADEHFLAAAERLAESGEESEALAYAGVWDRCMDALDTLSGAVGDESLLPGRFRDLLEVLFGVDSVGSVPPGIDRVQCGDVGRARPLSPRFLFLPGFTEGTYPRVSGGNLLSSKELRTLSDAEFDLRRRPEDVYEEEKLIAFTALTDAEEKLWIGLPAGTVTGDPLPPSGFLADIEALFTSLNEVRAADLPEAKRALTPDAAFERLAGLTGDPGADKAVLKAAVSLEEEKERALKSAERGVDGVFRDPAAAKDLFGNTLYMSASKAEGYHNCPFAFLCRYGLGADKIEVARIDARINGLVVHEALEKILASHRGESLTQIPPAQLKAEVDAAVSAYIEQNLSGKDNLSPAVLRSLDRVRDDIFGILSVIRSEAGVTDFRMRDMELKIGDPEYGVPAYVLPLADGAKIVLTGSVDRVDVMDKDGKTYLRVVDYKTGGKEFRLSDVFEGVNMQMLLYLFALCKNGKARYGDALPAGILYVPAKTAGETVGRRADAGQIADLRLKNGRMNGMLLSDPDVIRGMERDAAGVYVNAGINEDGSLNGNLLSAADFERLNRYTDEKLRDTGDAIRKGAFPVSPLDNGKHLACDYCPYKVVCLREDDGPYRKIRTMKHDDAVELLREEAKEHADA